MTYYPVSLDLTDRLCVVVGGGAVALRKARDLLAAGARVKVVGPAVDPELEALAAKGRIAIERAPFSPARLSGAHLAVVATDDELVNEAASRAAHEAGVLVNVADRPSLCDFHVPATLRRGDLLIAVSTAGKSPALAGRISRELAAAYGEEYAALLEIMGEVRRALQARGGSTQQERRKIFDVILDSEALALLGDGQPEEAARLARRIAGLDDG